MSATIHQLGSELTLGQNGTGAAPSHTRTYLVDLSAYKNATGEATFPPGYGLNVALGDESIGFNAQQEYTYGSEFKTSGTIGSSPYASVNRSGVWNVAHNLGGGFAMIQVMDPGTVMPDDGSKRFGDNALEPKQVISDVEFDTTIAKQFKFTTVAVANGASTNTDCLYCYDSSIGLNYYILSYAPDNVFVLAAANASKDWTFIDDPNSSGTYPCQYTSLDSNLDPGFPEEYEGGFIYRIASRYTPSGSSKC